MKWLLVVILSSGVQMHDFTTERACASAGNRIAYGWKRVHSTDENLPEVFWFCTAL